MATYLCVCVFPLSPLVRVRKNTSQFIPSWAGPGEPPPGVALRLSGVVSPWRPRDLSGAARDPRNPLICAKKNQTHHPPPSSPARHTPHAPPTLPQTPTNKPHRKRPTRTLENPPLRPWGSHNPKEQKKMPLEEIFRYIPFLFREISGSSKSPRTRVSWVFPRRTR